MQVDEGTVPEARGRSGGHRKPSKAASMSTAGPSSPAASWDSAPGEQPKMRTQYGSSQQQYPLDTVPSSAYGQVSTL